ncbi:MAG: DUF4870 domain-containing protein [Myxococcota bacterium]
MHEPTDEEKQMAMIAHLAGIAGIIGPLIVFAVKGNESTFVRYHAIQSLLFEFAYLGFVFIVIIPVSLCTFGFGSFLIFPIIPIVLGAHVWAGLKAQKGEWHGYPGVSGIGMPAE